jgi:hypothetical protein
MGILTVYLEKVTNLADEDHLGVVSILKERTLFFEATTWSNRRPVCPTCLGFSNDDPCDSP